MGRVLVKKMLEITEGVVASLTDFILSILFFCEESIKNPRVAHSFLLALAKVDERLRKVNYLSIKRAFLYVRQKGWIKEDLKPSQQGEERLKKIFIKYRVPKWDGNWYLVNFDIPEKLKTKRDILRSILIRLGFGKLQNSVWISPYNFLGNVEKEVKKFALTPYVVLSISNKVGRQEAKFLAERLWKISQIYNEYQNFIIKAKNHKESPLKLIFSYQAILRKDPMLPKELLPADWPGKEAWKLYLKLIKKLKENLTYLIRGRE